MNTYILSRQESSIRALSGQNIMTNKSVLKLMGLLFSYLLQVI